MPGVGEKTALKLLNEYGTLEGVYDNIDSIKGKLKEKLADNKELAFLSRTLATIKTDMDLDYKASDFVTSAHETEIVPLFDRLGFHSVTPRLIKAMGITAPTPVDSDSLFADFAESPTASKLEIAGIEAITPDFYKNKDLGIVVKAGGAHPFRTIDEIFVANGETVARLDGGHAKFAELLPTMLKDAATITTEDSKLLLEVTGDARPGTMLYLQPTVNREFGI